MTPSRNTKRLSMVLLVIVLYLIFILLLKYFNIFYVYVHNCLKEKIKSLLVILGRISGVIWNYKTLIITNQNMLKQ